jgi:hypothetical protein
MPVVFLKNRYRLRILPLSSPATLRARPERPDPCFGREHGRNKGEFNSLDGG